MSQRLGGVGGLLPPPQYLYPTELNNAAVDQGNNRFTLAAGGILTIPPGDWHVGRGPYTFLQSFDPVNNAWAGFSTALVGRESVHSDGVNFRLANLTGCPVAAIVVVGGSGYVQSSTTVTASAGSSTWQAIVGGMLSVTTVSVAGSGYGLAPLVLIPAPPSPGVQATGYATITGGSVTGVTLTNVGAGYITAPTITLVPNPFDPNLPTTAPVTATALCAIVGAGSVAAVLCTNNGAPQASAAAPTLTVAGVGSSASVVAVMCSTIASGSVVAGGLGIGSAGIITIGGDPSATPQYTNPAVQLNAAIPRPAQLTMAVTGGSLVSVSTIIDGGLFFGTPTAAVVASGGSGPSTLASVTVALGSTQDTNFLTPI